MLCKTERNKNVLNTVFGECTSPCFSKRAAEASCTGNRHEREENINWEGEERGSRKGREEDDKTDNEYIFLTLGAKIV